MSQATTILPEAKTRFSPHTRNILAQLRKRGWVYLMTRDYGLVRVTKLEARLLVKSGGDDLTAERLGGDVVLKNRV